MSSLRGAPSPALVAARSCGGRERATPVADIPFHHLHLASRTWRGFTSWAIDIDDDTRTGSFRSPTTEDQATRHAELCRRLIRARPASVWNVSIDIEDDAVRSHLTARLADEPTAMSLSQ